MAPEFSILIMFHVMLRTFRSRITQVTPIPRQQDYSSAPEFPRGDGTLTQWKHDDLEQVQLHMQLFSSVTL